MHRQDYQPNAVYIVNYLMKNTFESDFAVCKDKMSDIFICKDGKPKHISLTEFREMISECKVYKLHDGIVNYYGMDHIIYNSNTGLDFYKKILYNVKPYLKEILERLYIDINEE